MRLLSIKTKNYRTLADIELSFSRNYCTLSGRNNAGKSSVIRLLSILLGRRSRFAWRDEDSQFSFKEDRTQWGKSNTTIEVAYRLELTRNDDPALVSFIERIATIIAQNPVPVLELSFTVHDAGDLRIAGTFDGQPVDVKAAKEIANKIKEANILFLYNSAARAEDFYLGAGHRQFYELFMSEEDKKELDEAGVSIERRMRRLAREHKQGLNDMLGRLSERFDVEFAPPERLGTRHMPVRINLRDKHVQVPLDEWGSGTQNRTQIMMVIMQAKRIRTTASPDDRITPIVVIEEPESFLHPSAQAEFGRILRCLSQEFGVQILVTTHSPYMLDRESPESNILLCRRLKRGKAYETFAEKTSGSGWMSPFAEHLGLKPEEFSSWKPVFSTYKSRVLLVEGTTDQDYFTFFQKASLKAEALSKEIAIVPYGGKDTLKNTILLQFVLSQFDRVFVTYDLDAHGEAKSALGRLGLKESQDFLPVGVSKASKNCLEGLLPDRTLSAVNGRETDLVMKLTSTDSAERRHAKEQLKKLYLEEFKKHTDYSADELKEINKIIQTVNKRVLG